MLEHPSRGAREPAARRGVVGAGDGKRAARRDGDRPVAVPLEHSSPLSSLRDAVDLASAVRCGTRRQRSERRGAVLSQQWC